MDRQVIDATKRRQRQRCLAGMKAHVLEEIAALSDARLMRTIERSSEWRGMFPASLLKKSTFNKVTCTSGANLHKCTRLRSGRGGISFWIRVDT